MSFLETTVIESFTYIHTYFFFLPGRCKNKSCSDQTCFCWNTFKCKWFLSVLYESILCCVWKCGFFWMTIEVISIYVTKSWISAKLSWLSSSRPLVLRPHFQLSKTFLLSLFSADRQIPAPFINESLAQVLKFMNRQLRSLACHFFHLEFHFHLKKRSTFSFIR